VTGFQGWHRGRVTTLGRGGSDISAVALAVACQARRVEFVKDAAGLMTADPKLVPAAQPIPRASHKLITALAQAGARVLHPAAAELAERHGLPIALFSLDGEAPATLIEREAGQGVLGAVAARGLPRGETALTLVATDRGFARMVARRALPTLAALGIPVLGHGPGVSGFRIVVPSSRAAEALRCTHGELLAAGSQSARVACAAG
jgi:aspartate kinase